MTPKVFPPFAITRPGGRLKVAATYSAASPPAFSTFSHRGMLSPALPPSSIPKYVILISASPCFTFEILIQSIWTLAPDALVGNNMNPVK